MQTYDTILDNYRDFLIEHKDMSLLKIIGELAFFGVIMSNTSPLSKWYKKNGIERNVKYQKKEKNNKKMLINPYVCETNWTVGKKSHIKGVNNRLAHFQSA